MHLHEGDLEIKPKRNHAVDRKTLHHLGCRKKPCKSKSQPNSTVALLIPKYDSFLVGIF